MDRDRYTFTGKVDASGNVVAKSNGTTQRYISNWHIENMTDSKLRYGDEVTFELTFQSLNPHFHRESEIFHKVVNIDTLKVVKISKFNFRS